MYIGYQFISQSVAEKLNEVLAKQGTPSEDRLLVYSPKDQENKVGNIIIPGKSDEGTPHKGVVVDMGLITDKGDRSEREFKYNYTSIGNIITYGLYAGKEIEFDPAIFEEAGISLDLEHNTFTVLSLTEVIYSQVNPNK